ncbi:MAG: MMPL family transporter, partial [Micrococcales bacterium]|nr:MMPL family transporter [Micrococcales bacterium]
MLALGHFIVRHAKWVLFGFIGLIALSSVWGFQVFGNLKGGGYDNPNSDSATVTELLGSEFAVDPAEVIVLADLPGQANDLNADGMPKYFELVTALSDDLSQVEGVKSVLNYYTLGSPASLVSADGKLIYLLVDLENGISQTEAVATIVDEFTGDYQGAKVHIAGFGAVTKAINETI